MSVTTPDRIELTDPAAYEQRLLQRLEGRDPLDVLAATPEVLAEITNSHPDEALRKRPFEGKWTPNEVLGHMVDVELVMGFRTRAVMADPRPLLMGMDQDRWTEALRHNETPPDDHARRFRALREMNLAFWKGLSPDERDRTGVHAERGVTSLGHLITITAGHDLHHLEQLERYIAALK